MIRLLSKKSCIFNRLYDVKIWNVAHHRRTAVRPVLTAISQSNGNGQTSTPHRIKTP